LIDLKGTDNPQACDRDTGTTEKDAFDFSNCEEKRDTAGETAQKRKKNGRPSWESTTFLAKNGKKSTPGAWVKSNERTDDMSAGLGK